MPTISYFQFISSRFPGAFNIALVGELKTPTPLGGALNARSDRPLNVNTQFQKLLHRR
nr:MAG TPA: hypothetical protein [Caudoviricetes sp.]